MLFLSNPLPNYSGQFGVGAIDIEVPVNDERSIGKAVFKSNKEPALKLQTVFFTLYYPAGSVQDHRKKYDWIPRPISLIATGYAHFAYISNFLVNWIFTGALWLLVGSTKIPAVVDAPVLSLKPFEDSAIDLGDSQNMPHQIDKFSVLIFSHGMAGLRTSYSQFCGELASRGHVVAAIEHRDGSGPGTIIKKRQAKDRKVIYIPFDEVKAPNGEQYSGDDYKTDQKAFRSAEVEETVRVLRQLHAGQGQSISKLNARNEGSGILTQFQSRFDLSKIIIAGHSYGATLAMQTLSHSPDPRLPFQGAIILDPGKRSGTLNEDIKVPTLIVNSGSWSREIGHFDRVQKLTRRIMDKSKGRKAWFLTLLHTSHPSVTDAPLIEPWLLNFATGARLNAEIAMKAYVDISDDFIRFINSGGNEPKGVLRSEVNDPDGRAVRGEEQDAGRDATDRSEGESAGLEVPSPTELRNRAKSTRKAAEEVAKVAEWAVHVAPEIAAAIPPENND